MSRVSKPSASTVKPATVSGKAKPTSWKERLYPEDMDELKSTFDTFDEDGSGTIDPSEINKVLEELGLDKRNPFILHLINGLKDKNKPLTYDEFVDSVASQVGETKTRDGLKRVFALFDRDGNGIVDFEEFKSIGKQLHDSLTDDDILEMMHSASVNHKTSSNEGFTFEEFYTVVSKFCNK